jgi:hypothetical protein
MDFKVGVRKKVFRKGDVKDILRGLSADILQELLLYAMDLEDGREVDDEKESDDRGDGAVDGSGIEVDNDVLDDGAGNEEGLVDGGEDTDEEAP